MASKSVLSAPPLVHPITVIREVTLPRPVVTVPKFSRWLLQTVALTVLLCGATVFLNWRGDALGTFGKKSVSIYAFDRFSKYVMSFRYVPDHFDGLLLGNSITTNWDTSIIRDYRVFNCSFRAGTITEEDLIARNVLKRGHLKMAVVLLHPSFTADYGSRTPYMTPSAYWATYGSVQTTLIYAQQTLERFAPKNTDNWFLKHRYFDSGAQLFRVAHETGPAAEPVQEFAIDPHAREELVSLLNEFHKKNVKIYFVLPPIYHERWLVNGEQVKAYDDDMLRYASPKDVVIDLNDGSLDSITSVHANFPDYTHMDPVAARGVVKLLASRIAKE